MTDRTYSVTDAARELGVSPQTIYRWLKEGRLVETRDEGGKRRVTAESVEARPEPRDPWASRREEGE